MSLHLEIPAGASSRVASHTVHGAMDTTGKALAEIETKMEGDWSRGETVQQVAPALPPTFGPSGSEWKTVQ